jgi:hypothetical protein
MSSVLASAITLDISAAEQWSHDIASLGLDGSSKSSDRGELNPARQSPLVGGGAARASALRLREQGEGQTRLKRFHYEMFYYRFQEDRTCWYQGAVLPGTKNFPTAPKANKCEFANGTRAKFREGSSADSSASEDCDCARVYCETRRTESLFCPAPECRSCATKLLPRACTPARDRYLPFAATHSIARPWRILCQLGVAQGASRTPAEIGGEQHRRLAAKAEYG